VLTAVLKAEQRAERWVHSKAARLVASSVAWLVSMRAVNSAVLKAAPMVGSLAAGMAETMADRSVHWTVEQMAA
jgi:hypothetical protein